jgi:Tfp pilus assembly protein PilF
MLLASVLAGCATRRPPTLTDRLIASAGDGDAPVLDLPLPPAPAATRAPAGVPASPQSKTSDLPVVERQDPALRDALAELGRHPSAEAHRRVAAGYRHLGILDLARDHLEHAVRLDPDDAASRDALARVWRDWGVPGAALGEAHRATYFAPGSAAARNTLGTVLVAIGQSSAAAGQFAEAARLDAGAAYAWSNLCYLSLLSGRAGAARRQCGRALAIAPAFAPARNNLALVHAASGDLAAAEREFLRAGGTVAADYNMGIVHMARREYGSAAARFRAVLAAQPGLESARRRLQHAERLAGRPVAASTRLDTIARKDDER